MSEDLKESIKESVKSAKSLHHAILLASAACLAFLAGTGDPSRMRKVYEAGVDELRQLAQMESLLEEYHHDARSRLNGEGIAELRDAFDFTIPLDRLPYYDVPPRSGSGVDPQLQFPPLEPFVPAPPAPLAAPAIGRFSPIPRRTVPTRLAGHTVEIAADDPAANPFLRPFPEIKLEDFKWPLPMVPPADSISPDCLQMWGNALAIRIETPPLDDTLSDILTYFKRGSSVYKTGRDATAEIFFPSPRDLSDNLRRFAQKYPGGKVVEWKVISPRMEIEQRWDNRAPYGYGRLEVRVSDAEGKSHTEIEDELRGVWACGTCGGRVTPYVKFLQGRQEFAKNSSILTGTGQIKLDNLKKVWSDVSNKSIEEAIATLESKIMATEEKISFFTIVVSDQAASTMFSIVNCVLLLTILCYVRHLCRCGIASDFGWAVLFQSPFAVALTWASFVVIPVAINGVLIGRQFARHAGWTTWFLAFLFAVLSVPPAIIICLNTRSLRKQIRDSSASS